MATSLTYDPRSGLFYRRGKVVGTLNKNGYVYVYFDGRSRLAHRVAWYLQTGDWPVADIDHINGKRTDNHFANLREATRSQNLMNKKAGYANRNLPKNVQHISQHNLYRVRFKVDGKEVHGGYYSKLSEATERAVELRKEYHGEYAKI